MECFAYLLYWVFSQLAVGGLALLLIIPKDLVGRGFYRLMALDLPARDGLCALCELGDQWQSYQFQQFLPLHGRGTILFLYLPSVCCCFCIR